MCNFQPECIIKRGHFHGPNVYVPATESRVTQAKQKIEEISNNIYNMENLNPAQQARLDELLEKYPFEVVQDMMTEPEFITLK